MIFTEQQESLISTTENSFFEACPGAGKTAAIVERFYRLISDRPRKGIALLSFSRAAVEEVRARCVDNNASLLSPHFVGTFDTFVNRFIVSPVFSSTRGLTPRFVDCWENIDVRPIRLSPPYNYAEYSLDWFELGANLNAELIVDRIVGENASQLRRLADYNLQAIQNAASVRINNLINRGIISSAESRRLMSEYISGEISDAVLSPLIHRFSEILVDEAQDCGVKEILLLKKLKENGVRIVMIGDMDQAIYEFRDATPDLLNNFVSESGFIRYERMNVNHRSVLGICKLVNSLRTGRSQDVPASRNENVSEQALYLLPYAENSEVIHRLNSSLSGNLDLTSCIVLSHATKDAKECSGNQVSNNASANRVIRFAYAAHVVSSTQSTPQEKLKYASMIERIMLGLVEGITVASKPTDLLLDELGISRRWLRNTVSFLAWTTTFVGMTREIYTRLVREKFATLTLPRNMSIGNVNRYFQIPRQEAWDSFLGVVPSADSICLPFSTIHGVKGKEFSGVILVIPRNLRSDDNGKNVLDYWEDDINHEAKRVLYVGASRAKSKLVLAVHNSHMAKIRGILESNNVLYEEI